MKHTSKFSVLAFLLMFLFAAPLFASTPKAAVTGFLDTIKSLEFPEPESAVVEKANHALDLESMSAQALTGTWENLSEEDRGRFLTLMWQLIEKVAYKKSQSFLGDLKIEYNDPVEEENGSVFIASVVDKGQESLNPEIIYYLRPAGDDWQIYDIILDGVSIIEDLSYQYQKILEESGFEGLINRMQERLVKAEEELS